jgi:hypothetical protein
MKEGQENGSKASRCNELQRLALKNSNSSGIYYYGRLAAG